MPARKIQIAVIGYNNDRCSDQARDLAYRTGSEIAKAGAVLVCGGLAGVMEAACKGAHDNRGLCIGIIPQNEFSFANPYCDIVIPTGVGYARDFIVASSADGIIAIGGGVGTLIEMAVGYMTKKMIIALEGSGGVAEQYRGKHLDERNYGTISASADPTDAVNRIVKSRTGVS